MTSVSSRGWETKIRQKVVVVMVTVIMSLAGTAQGGHDKSKYLHGAMKVSVGHCPILVEGLQEKKPVLEVEEEEELSFRFQLQSCLNGTGEGNVLIRLVSSDGTTLLNRLQTTLALGEQPKKLLVHPKLTLENFGQHLIVSLSSTGSTEMVNIQKTIHVSFSPSV